MDCWNEMYIRRQGHLKAVGVVNKICGTWFARQQRSHFLADFTLLQGSCNFRHDFRQHHPLELNRIALMQLCDARQYLLDSLHDKMRFQQLPYYTQDLHHLTILC